MASGLGVPVASVPCAHIKVVTRTVVTLYYLLSLELAKVWTSSTWFYLADI